MVNPALVVDSSFPSADSLCEFVSNWWIPAVVVLCALFYVHWAMCTGLCALGYVHCALHSRCASAQRDFISF